jgi:glycerophosphoryl diester phosphodiesterase
MRFLAHRGLHEDLPLSENSASALAEAIAHPRVDGLECDIRVLGDGTPVVFHDADAHRLLDDPRALHELDQAAWAGLRLSDGSAPPTLRDAMDLLRGALARPDFDLNLELKPAPRHEPIVSAVAPFLRELAAHDTAAPGRLVVSSFDARILAALALHPDTREISLAYLVERPQAFDALAFLPRPPVALHVAHRLLADCPAPILAWRGRAGEGALLRAYTVNDLDDAQQLLSLPEPFRPDGLITDRPLALRAGLSRP